MRKISILGLALAAFTAALGWFVNEQFFVLIAYFGCLFVPIIVIGVIYNLMNKKGRMPWPAEHNDGAEQWPNSLNPDRKQDDNNNPMW